MRKGAIVFIAVFNVVVFWHTPAQALLCALASIAAPQTQLTYNAGGGGYDVFDTNSYMQSATFNVTVTAAVGCQYYVTLVGGANDGSGNRLLSHGSNLLRYNVYKDAGGTQRWMGAGSYGQAHVISKSFNEILVVTVPHTFYWNITPGQVVPHFTTPYENFSVTATLYVLTLLTYVESGSVTFTFRANVQSSVFLSVGTADNYIAGNHSHVVNMGDIENGVFKDFKTVIRSNDGYKLSMESQNGQKLRHQSLGVEIPYDLTFNSSPIDLRGGGEVGVISVPGVTTAMGQPYTSRVGISEMPAGVPYGEYLDVISLTVKAY